MQKNKIANKTTNLARAIMLLVKNVEIKSEKTLLSKIENACYDLIDITHNDETKISAKLDYISDLMILARQVNLFLDENTLFIISIIAEISKIYEIKLLPKNEEVINEKIRDILQGGEMSETESEETRLSSKETENKLEVIRGELTKVKDVEKLSETKINIFNFAEQKRKVLESKNIRDTKEVRDISLTTNNVISNSINSRKLSRKEEVIRSLSHTPVSIKDISEKVLGCSEKTIQRELNNLVDEKVIVRIGEKRWSKYVLA